MKIRKFIRNLYMIMGETIQEGNMSVETTYDGEQSMMMWHHKLGHMLET